MNACDPGWKVSFDSRVKANLNDYDVSKHLLLFKTLKNNNGDVVLTSHSSGV